MKLTSVDIAGRKPLKECVRKGLGVLACAAAITAGGAGAITAFAQTPPQVERSVSSKPDTIRHGKDSIEHVLETWHFETYYNGFYPGADAVLLNQSNLWPWIFTYSERAKDDDFTARLCEKYAAIAKDATDPSYSWYDNPDLENWKVCMAAVCFRNPELFNKPQFKELLSLDSATAAKMMAAALDWQQPYAAFGDTTGRAWARDMIMLYEIAKKHKGVPIAKTLFEEYNITYFGQYPIDVIEHLYFDKDRATGKPLMLMVFTKEQERSEFGCIIRGFYTQELVGTDSTWLYPGTDNYKNFDVRICEPGTTKDMISIMKKISHTLGKKIRFFVIDGHGWPDDVRPLVRAGDKSLKRIKPLLSDSCDIIFNACAVAGENKGEKNVAEFTAEILKARSFGAVDQFRGGRTSLVRVLLNADNTEVLSVIYPEVETKVYDYRQGRH